jgi:hypothetical protein
LGREAAKLAAGAVACESDDDGDDVASENEDDKQQQASGTGTGSAQQHINEQQQQQQQQRRDENTVLEATMLPGTPHSFPPLSPSQALPAAALPMQPLPAPVGDAKPSWQQPDSAPKASTVPKNQVCVCMQVQHSCGCEPQVRASSDAVSALTHALTLVFM